MAESGAARRVGAAGDGIQLCAVARPGRRNCVSLPRLGCRFPPLTINFARSVEYGGELTLGGTNTSAYTGDIDFIDLPLGREGGFWNIPLVCECLRTLYVID